MILPKHQQGVIDGQRAEIQRLRNIIDVRERALKMVKYLIWWTSQADYERITPLDTWPKWLYDEFQSRGGRSGRGRLWVSDKFGDAPEEAVWDDNKWTCQIANDAGGIVIPLADLHHVWMLPGFITDFSMASPSLTDLVETAPNPAPGAQAEHMGAPLKRDYKTWPGLGG